MNVTAPLDQRSHHRTRGDTRPADRTRNHGAARGGTPTGGYGSPSRRPQPPEIYRRRRVAAVCILLVLALAGLYVVQRARGGSAADAASNETLPVAAPLVSTAPAADAAAPEAGAADVEPAVEADIEAAACMLEIPEVSAGDEGTDVECAQRALRAAGVYEGEITGVFDGVTSGAARAFQAEYGLYVDGIVGKNTATELGIWPGAEAFIVRTDPPAPGAVDLWGLPLSSVASAGDDAPPLPADAGQGTGKRVVYERASQRVWAIDDQERVVRSYLVTGSRYRNEVPGVHRVYSKSEVATGWDLKANLPYMIRYTETERGHIGFHAIPYWNDTGEYLQTEAELGQKLSGGCTRQAYLDAQFLWQFADVGTKVHVL